MFYARPVMTQRLEILKRVQLPRLISSLSGLACLVSGVIMLYQGIRTEGEVQIRSLFLAGNITLGSAGFLLIVAAVVLMLVPILKPVRYVEDTANIVPDSSTSGQKFIKRFASWLVCLIIVGFSAFLLWTPFRTDIGEGRLQYEKLQMNSDTSRVMGSVAHSGSSEGARSTDRESLVKYLSFREFLDNVSRLQVVILLMVLVVVFFLGRDLLNRVVSSLFERILQPTVKNMESFSEGTVTFLKTSAERIEGVYKTFVQTADETRKAAVETLEELPKAIETGLRSGTEIGVKAAAPEMFREVTEVLPGFKKWLALGTEWVEYKLKDQVYRYEPRISAGDKTIHEGILEVRLLRETDLRKALEYVRRLKKEHPDVIDVLLEEAIVLQDLNQMEEAKEVISEVWGLFKGPNNSPERAEILLRAGLVELSAGNYGQALTNLGEANGIRPDDPRILDSMSIIPWRQSLVDGLSTEDSHKKVEEAFEWSKRAKVALEAATPPNIRLKHRIMNNHAFFSASCAKTMKEALEAVEEARSLVEFSDKNPYWLHTLGFACRRAFGFDGSQKWLTEAERLFLATLTIKPDHKFATQDLKEVRRLLKTVENQKEKEPS